MTLYYKLYSEFPKLSWNVAKSFKWNRKFLQYFSFHHWEVIGGSCATEVLNWLRVDQDGDLQGMSKQQKGLLGS